MDKSGRDELAEALRERYQRSQKRDKTKILDEFVAITGYHRKHALRVLRGANMPKSLATRIPHRIYDEAVKEALIVLWEASDRICGKRLKAIIPELLKAMEGHERLKPSTEVRERLLSISAATIDRLMQPIRNHASSHKRRRPVRKIRAGISVKTFADWEDVVPGNFEIDFVAHCGGTLVGSFIHSLVATDVCSGWTEATPLLMREQSMVVEGLDVLRCRMPILMLGINSDNDSAFINESVVAYCGEKRIVFSRSRPYRKNDQAWIEQKNGSVVRRFVGYSRFSGHVAGQTMAHLYGNLRLFVNYFQPSFKLLNKSRDGAKVTKTYTKPITPCERLLAHSDVSEAVKTTLRKQRAILDPMALLHSIRQAQSALASLAAPDRATHEQERELDQFLASLPRLWKQGEVRPTHRQGPAMEREYRTRIDPFEGDWAEVLSWLEESPDATAKSLFDRLQKARPGKYEPSQLRTLQRRVRQWRGIMAKQLIYGTAEDEVRV